MVQYGTVQHSTVQYSLLEVQEDVKTTANKEKFLEIVFCPLSLLTSFVTIVGLAAKFEYTYGLYNCTRMDCTTFRLLFNFIFNYLISLHSYF